jgi:hypothetical protein
MSPSVMPVRDLLQALHQQHLVDRVDANAHAILGDRVDRLVEAARQLLGELLGLEQAGEHAAGREALAHALGRDLRGVAPDRRVGIELRIERARDLVDVEQRLAQHRELARRAIAQLRRLVRRVEQEAARARRPSCAGPGTA